MDWIGLTTGFLTATFSAGAFLSSAWALKSTKGATAPGMLMNAGVVMGAIAALMLAVLWKDGIIACVCRHPLVLAGTSVFFALGQAFVFAAQRQIEASRVVPLLGFKLPMLALISALLFKEHVGIFQWLALTLTFLAAFILNNAGSSFSVSGIAFVLLGCLSYCVSDLSLTAMTNFLGSELNESNMLSALHCTALSYVLVGLIAAFGLCVQRKKFTMQALRNSVPFAVMWVTCIVFLTLTFARLGTVHGTILQNMRGILTILFTPICIWFGCTAIESKLTASLFWRRMVAALMVLASVFLYNLGK
ncbi:MAG: EamA family transporter [Lentisphaeria bacterium]|nr:EamA family transporter [Lentisphaeria bacterium]